MYMIFFIVVVMINRLFGSVIFSMLHLAVLLVPTISIAAQ